MKVEMTLPFCSSFIYFIYLLNILIVLKEKDRKNTTLKRRQTQHLNMSYKLLCTKI